jgi:hypothetical protein
MKILTNFVLTKTMLNKWEVTTGRGRIKEGSQVDDISDALSTQE